jgi:hypothetical protein
LHLLVADQLGAIRNTEQGAMTREEAIEKLKECQKNGDTEAAHSEADDVLCQLLNALGYAIVVAEYEKIDKWYA